MLECVVNISEGSDARLVGQLAGDLNDLLDVHSDADHNRSVFTLIGTEAPRELASRAVRLLDINRHSGVHPRLGVVDVVPFVALEGSADDAAAAARDEFAEWIVDTHRVPVFLYGPERPLPDVRRRAWKSLAPDRGPNAPHPTAGAVCVGVRQVLVAYNVVLDSHDPDLGRRIANAVRMPGLRTLAFTVSGTVQISMNIVEADRISVSDAYDRVAEVASSFGAAAVGAELVGLLPRKILDRVDETRWSALDIGVEKTIEWRLSRR